MSASLLARIRRGGRSAAATSREEAILAHLALLLNTRQGSSALDPSYGLPDLTDFAHRIPEALPAMQRLLAETIQRHEPRLQSVSVTSAANGATQRSLSLQFEVRAVLRTGGALQFRTRVSQGGQVSIG